MKILNTVSQYTYLGLLMTEYLGYEITARHVAEAANRALGLIIAKYKAFEGLPTMVWSVISYGAGIRDTKQYSYINAIQTRAERYILDVGRYPANSVIQQCTVTQLGLLPLFTSGLQ